MVKTQLKTQGAGIPDAGAGFVNPGVPAAPDEIDFNYNDLEDATKRVVMPAGEYVMHITDKSKRTDVKSSGRPQITWILAFVDHPEAVPIFLRTVLPWKVAFVRVETEELEKVKQTYADKNVKEGDFEQSGLFGIKGLLDATGRKFEGKLKISELVASNIGATFRAKVKKTIIDFGNLKGEFQNEIDQFIPAQP